MLLVGDYKSSDGKDYFFAIIDKQNRSITFAKNFSCQAQLSKLYPSSQFKIEFTGRRPDINKVSDKYRTFKIS